MLGQRQRRWANIEAALGEWQLFVVYRLHVNIQHYPVNTSTLV